MKKIISYNRALDYLFSQLPMYQRQGPKAFKKDLTNIKALLKALDHPENSLKVVHVAGTNGKGTVSHIITGCLMSQGYRVGLYTSPHYRDFRERIRINGNYIPKNTVVRYVNLLMNMVSQIKPSFFEMTVAMSFLYFREQKVDYAVIETGLGGRLDSTNVVNPLVSVITNISLDHTLFLGDTLTLIAREKAGIIKKGRPVVIGERQDETTAVYKEVAQARDASMTFAEDIIEIVDGQANYKGAHLMNITTIDMGGPFVKKNLITSLATLVRLKEEGINISWKKVEEGLVDTGQRVGYIGRWMWISKNPDILVDSAHNIGAIHVMLKHLPSERYRGVHFVLGFVNDKAVEPLLSLFPKNAFYYWAKANIPRGLNAETLRQKGKETGLAGKSYSSVRKALAAARKKAGPDDLIFVGGSIFTVAEVV